MARKAIIMANLQQEMDKTKTGVLLSVKLLNKDELNVLIADTSAIIYKFCVMVHTA
jgi:hypothetical protein